MWGILGVFLQAAAGQILYLALHLESGSFPRPLSPAAERAAFAALRTGGAAGRDARDQLVRHNLRLVAHVCKKYYAATSNQDDLISIGTIGLIKAVDTFDPARASKFASYASRCIERAPRRCRPPAPLGGYLACAGTGVAAAALRPGRGVSGYPAADCRQAGHQPQLCFPVRKTRPDSVDERLAPMNEKSM